MKLTDKTRDKMDASFINKSQERVGSDTSTSKLLTTKPMHEFHENNGLWRHLLLNFIK